LVSDVGKKKRGKKERRGGGILLDINLTEKV
jgi:hypothetical protein